MSSPSPPRGSIPLLRASLVTLTLGVLGSCESPLEPLSVPRGHYEYARVGETPGWDCGYDIEESSVILGPRNEATFTELLRYGSATSAFVGRGTFKETADGIEVRVRGRWSHAPEVGVMRYGAVFTVAGTELHRFSVGACDAVFRAVYVLQAEFAVGAH